MSAGIVRSQAQVRGRSRKAVHTTGTKPLVLKLSQFSEDNFPVRVRKLRQPPAKAAQVIAGDKYPVKNSLEQPRDPAKPAADENQLD